MFSGGHKYLIPDSCSLTSKHINIAKLQRYHLKDQQITQEENFEDIFEFEETLIASSSLEIQKKISKEIGGCFLLSITTKCKRNVHR
jgi:hypothetical protein